MGRHHAPGRHRPDRPDQWPNRIGAHELHPFRPEQVPAEQLLRQLRTRDGA